ncbi:MAG: 3-deoxy-7-phosphoheptulonate synthase [Candidatus Firestonebacteria bacterium]|nr:3-deoxy-7-phosphoheptulonate synthase [Candidatus Firestonebacteria bacterium]
MIIVLKPNATEEQIKHICDKLTSLGVKLNISKGVERTVIGAIGQEDNLRAHPIEILPGVEKVLAILKPYKMASRDFKKENTIINIDNLKIGDKKIVIMAGPCSVESRAMMFDIAEKVKKSGAHIIRGGAFKPRTSPYDFQGLGEEGLKILAEVKKAFGLPVVTEVMDTRDVELVANYSDIIQIGARNMQNFNLLKEVGKSKIPVLLKRGLSATIKEFLMSAEYIMSEGNYNVILCERGIRTFSEETRNTLDLSAVPVLKKLTHLPVVVDPSHATGKWELVEPMAKASIACGCDGLIIEVHPCPEDALSDGAQSLLPEKFDKLILTLKPVAEAVGRTI